MPELPEVETVVRGLKKFVLGERIVDVSVRRQDVLAGLNAAAFGRMVRGAQITSVRRRGKFIIIELDGCRSLIIHLRMTGRLTYSSQGAPLLPHTHVIFRVNSGMELRFSDTRRFGYLKILELPSESASQALPSLGPEPLGKLNIDEFTHMIAAVGRSRRPLKSWLLDQRWIAGIGNIYADEILFDARIRPDRLPGSLTAAEIGRLFESIRRILRAAIRSRGTTFSDYIDLMGEPGVYARRLRVYQRQGLPCSRCPSKVRKIKIGGRSTHYCPKCQL